MKWMYAILGIVVAWYIGCAIGVYSLCESDPKLYRVKKYAFYMPLAYMCLIVHALKDLTNPENHDAAKMFLRSPMKCKIIVYCFAAVMAEKRDKYPRTAVVQRRATASWRNVLATLCSSMRTQYYAP